jgi:hypothetical protein
LLPVTFTFSVIADDSVSNFNESLITLTGCQNPEFEVAATNKYTLACDTPTVDGIQVSVEGGIILDKYGRTNSPASLTIQGGE